MTKDDVSKAVAKKIGLESEVCKKSIEVFMDVVKKSIKAGEPVYLRGFGTFLPKKQAEKTARNISKGTLIIVPARVIPSFKPSKAFKNSLI